FDRQQGCAIVARAGFDHGLMVGWARFVRSCLDHQRPNMGRGHLSRSGGPFLLPKTVLPKGPEMFPGREANRISKQCFFESHVLYNDEYDLRAARGLLD